MCPRPCHVQVTRKKQGFASCESAKNIGVYLVAVGSTYLLWLLRRYHVFFPSPKTTHIQAKIHFPQTIFTPNPSQFHDHFPSFYPIPHLSRLPFHFTYYFPFPITFIPCLPTFHLRRIAPITIHNYHTPSSHY